MNLTPSPLPMSKEDAVEVSVTEEVKEAPKEREETFSEVEEVVPEEESINGNEDVKKEQRSRRHVVEALEDLADAMMRRLKDKKKW